MKKIVFQKNYTRDTSLVVQKLWFKAHDKAINDFLKSKKEIFGIDHLNNGSIEIWENADLLKKLKSILVKKSFQSKNKIFSILNRTKIEMKEFEKLWKRKYLSDRNELVAFINKAEKMMYANLLYSYLCLEKGAEKEIKNLAGELRAADHFFAHSDNLIRNSIKKIFPSAKDFENCITINEIKNNKIPSAEILKKRLSSFFQDSGKEKFLGDLRTFQAKHPEYIFINGDSKNSRIIKGQIANRGKITGRVKIVRRNNDMLKIKKGDIVVSPMTTPAIVSGLKKASGIVTDEGGMLCHAAVISRELNIPCVIGTKIATKVLKDGDLVEVDANKGVIKILN